MTKEINSWDDWAEDIINGVGGFRDWAKYEMPIFNHKEDVEIVLWVIGCLTNERNKEALMQLNKMSEIANAVKDGLSAQEKD